MGTSVLDSGTLSIFLLIIFLSISVLPLLHADINFGGQRGVEKSPEIKWEV